MQYVYGKYGRDRAALAATLITYRPKSAVRDVGKALGLDLAQVDRLTGVFAWWDGRAIDPARIREAGFDPDNPLIARLVTLAGELHGLPAPPVAARRRLRHRARPARADGAGRERRDGGPHGHPVGQGRPRCDGPAQGRLPGARHALGDPARARRWSRSGAASRCACRTFRPRTRRSTRCASAPTPSACSRSNRARSSRCCRASSPRTSTISSSKSRSCGPGPIQGGMVHPYLKRRQGTGARHVSERRGEERARAHARRADLPGAGDAARDRRRRLHAGRGRPAAPLDGGVAAQGRPREIRAAAGRRHGRARLRRDVRAADLPADPGLRRIRLSRNRTRRRSRCSSTCRRGSSTTSRRRSAPRCSTRSRWASTRPRNSCRTRAGTASKCATST